MITRLLPAVSYIVQATLTGALYIYRVRYLPSSSMFLDDVFVFFVPLTIGAGGFVLLTWISDRTRGVDELLPIALWSTVVGCGVMVVTFALLIRYVGS